MQLFNEDCLEGMNKQPDNSIDLIVVDPPFCVGVSSNGTRSTFTEFSLMRPFFDSLFAQWYRVLKDGRHVYINTDWRTYPFLSPILQKYFVVRNLIVWDIQWLKAGNFYRHTHELIIFASKGKTQRTWSPSETDIWQCRCVNNVQYSKLHPAQKPIELCERMIRNSSLEGDTVLDCFMGSGTTGVACVNSGRDFIGFELDEKFFNIAQRRINDAINQREQNLFKEAVS